MHLIKKNLHLIVSILVIVGVIIFVQSRPGAVSGCAESFSQGSYKGGALSVTSRSEKAKSFSPGIDFSSPDCFINSEPFKLADVVGKKVILVDFWTYSCINCQRTVPHLNELYKKYKDKGLLIVGVHTPEFDFEKKYANVSEHVKDFGIEYPVVMDNDFSTWNEYKNRYWPRKYLIDIDGYVVYDHIGEGSYAETERKIQELLSERDRVLGENNAPKVPITKDTNPGLSFGQSPETYFGSLRNNAFGNGTRGKTGEMQLTIPQTIKANTLYLGGAWNIQKEYAENISISAETKIVYKYKAKSVYFVAGSPLGVDIKVLLDGIPLKASAGSDVVVKNGTSILHVEDERLYSVIESKTFGEHTLELQIPSPGLQAYTFTFGS